MGAPERAVLIVNPAAGQRHAEDGDLADCVRLLTAAGFDIDRRQTGTEGPTSADLAKSALAEGFRVVLVAGGDGTVAPAAIAPQIGRATCRAMVVETW